MADIENNLDGAFFPGFNVGSELSQESFNLQQNDLAYLLANQRFWQYYTGYLKPRLAMYDGWVQGFHDIEYGFIPTKMLQSLAQGIVQTIFNKPMVVNSNCPETKRIIKDKFSKTNWDNAVKANYEFCVAGGSALLKWNKKDGDQLDVDYVRADRFFAEVDTYGKIFRVVSYINFYSDGVTENTQYGLCEERYFTTAKIAKTVNGKSVTEDKNIPMVRYVVYKLSGSTVMDSPPKKTVPSVPWCELPEEVRVIIKHDYSTIMVDDEQSSKWAVPLPFDDYLGCEIISFTRTNPSFPKLPYGQPIADLLMNECYAYDQLEHFDRFEVYAARARTLINGRQINKNDPDGKKKVLDPLLYVQYDSGLSSAQEGNAPTTVQPELRAEKSNIQLSKIMNKIAQKLNLASTTIASWLADGQSEKTASEVELSRGKTQSFINDKLSIITKPLQKMIDCFFHYYGVEAPTLAIMPEPQSPRSENIKLYSELYGKKQITPEMFAKIILDTDDVEEINKFVSWLLREEQAAQMSVAQGGGKVG